MLCYPTHRRNDVSTFMVADDTPTNVMEPGVALVGVTIATLLGFAVLAIWLVEKTLAGPDEDYDDGPKARPN